MYVRLKHTLSALALEMLIQTPRSRPLPWLLAYVGLAPQAEEIPLADLRRAAAARGGAASRTLRRLEALGLLEREGGRIRLAPEYRPHRDYFARQVGRMGVALRAVDRVGDRDGSRRPPVPLRLGIILFNAGLFFECHEFLETLWRATPGPDRDLYHGIIQVAAAFYHFEKGNQHGARTLLAKGLARLRPYRPAHLGVEVDRLVAGLTAWRRRFRSAAPGGPLPAGKFPRIGVRATI